MTMPPRPPRRSVVRSHHLFLPVKHGDCGQDLRHAPIVRGRRTLNSPRLDERGMERHPACFWLGPVSSVEDTDMKPDQTIPEVRKADGEGYYWGDLVTLRLLLGACMLMWTLGLVHVLVRICFR
jgi:hypothetical protein